MSTASPVDHYFGYCVGKLRHRSLRFEHSTLDPPKLQQVAVVNNPRPRCRTRASSSTST